MVNEISLNKKSLFLRNNTIDIFRFIFAVNVVLFHCNAFTEVSSTLNYILTHIPTRVAVPFFFTVGGYFFCAKLVSGDRVKIIKYLKKEIIIYSLWSVFYFLFILFAMRDETVDLGKYFYNCLHNFFLSGSYYHIWYIPAMLFSTAVVFLAYKIRKFKLLNIISVILFLLGCLFTGYYYLGIKIQPINSFLKMEYSTVFIRFLCRGLPFVTLGASVFLNREKSQKNKKKLCIAFIAISVLFCVEQYLIVLLELVESPVNTVMLYPFVGIIFVIMLQHPMPKLEKTGQICGKNSSFIYFSHPAIIICIDRAVGIIGLKKYLTPTVLAIFTVTIAILSQTVLSLILKFAKRTVKRA